MQKTGALHGRTLDKTFWTVVLTKVCALVDNFLGTSSEPLRFYFIDILEITVCLI